jgi:hypothetical protein
VREHTTALANSLWAGTSVQRDLPSVAVAAMRSVGFLFANSPDKVDGTLVNAMSGNELSRVRTEFRLRPPEPINQCLLETSGPTSLCEQVPYARHQSNEAGDPKFAAGPRSDIRILMREMNPLLAFQVSDLRNEYN